MTKTGIDATGHLATSNGGLGNDLIDGLTAGVSRVRPRGETPLDRPTSYLGVLSESKRVLDVHPEIAHRALPSSNCTARRLPAALWMIDALVRRSECVPSSSRRNPIAVTHSSTNLAYCRVPMWRDERMTALWEHLLGGHASCLGRMRS